MLSVPFDRAADALDAHTIAHEATVSATLPVIEFALKSPSERNLTPLPETLRIVPPPELAWAHQRQETGRGALAFNVFPDELSAALQSHTIEQIMVWGVRHNDYAGEDFQAPHWQHPQQFAVVPLNVDPDHPRYHALNGMLAIQVAGGGILGTVAPNAPKLPVGSSFSATVQPQNAIVNLHVDPDSIRTPDVEVAPVSTQSEFAQEMQALLGRAIAQTYERSGQSDVDTQFPVGTAWSVTITPTGEVTVVDASERIVFAEDWQDTVVQVPLSDRDAQQLEQMLQARQVVRSQVGGQSLGPSHYSFNSGLE